MSLCRTALPLVRDAETLEPVVSRVLMEADSAISVSDSDSTSVGQELMGVDGYYSNRKPVHGWTPKSLLDSPAVRRFQEDVMSSCESTQTGWLCMMTHCR